MAQQEPQNVRTVKKSKNLKFYIFLFEESLKIITDELKFPFL
jgi:hypothetical protein